MELQRPNIITTLVEDGQYNGFTGVPIIKLIPSQYHEGGWREVVSLPVVVETEDGVIELNYICTAIWSPKGKLFSLLQNLRVLPAVGEHLDFESMAGIRVTVTIENVVREQYSYPNIVAIARKKKVKKSNLVRN